MTGFPYFGGLISRKGQLLKTISVGLKTPQVAFLPLMCRSSLRFHAKCLWQSIIYILCHISYWLLQLDTTSERLPAGHLLPLVGMCRRSVLPHIPQCQIQGGGGGVGGGGLEGAPPPLPICMKLLSVIMQEISNFRGFLKIKIKEFKGNLKEFNF